MRERAWETPQLIVLLRGQPEETLLVGCKTSTIAGTSLKHGGCAKSGACGQTCATIGTS